MNRPHEPPATVHGISSSGAREERMVLILRAGTHRLSRPLKIHQSLTLVGDGRKSARVACSSPGYVMRVEGDGRFAARDVTFTHEGAQGAHVVEVQCGEIDLRRCS